jgi:peptidyl-prolyl cis-trans isomerase B (cyclophilin B)
MPAGAPYYYQAYPSSKTNGLAIAALVCGICGFIYLVPAILGVVFGCISLRQIRRDGTDGRGMAITGIVTGSLWLALVVAIVIALIAAAN